MQTDRQRYRMTDKQTDRDMDKQKDHQKSCGQRITCWPDVPKQIERHTDQDRQTDSLADRHADRLTNSRGKRITS